MLNCPSDITVVSSNTLDLAELCVPSGRLGHLTRGEWQPSGHPDSSSPCLISQTPKRGARGHKSINTAQSAVLVVMMGAQHVVVLVIA